MAEVVVGKRELLSFAQRQAKVRVASLRDLASGEVLCKLLSTVFPAVALPPAHRDTNSRSQQAAHNWGLIDRAARQLQIPPGILDRQPIARGDTKACQSALVLLFFLHTLCKDGDCSIQFSVELSDRVGDFVQSPRSVLALVLGGAMQIDQVPPHIRKEIEPQLAPMLWRRNGRQQRSSSGGREGAPPTQDVKTPNAHMHAAYPTSRSQDHSMFETPPAPTRDGQTPTAGHGGHQRHHDTVGHDDYGDDGGNDDAFALSPMGESERRSTRLHSPSQHRSLHHTIDDDVEESDDDEHMLEDANHRQGPKNSGGAAHPPQPPPPDTEAFIRDLMEDLETLHTELDKQLKEKADIRGQLNAVVTERDGMVSDMRKMADDVAAAETGRDVARRARAEMEGELDAAEHRLREALDAVAGEREKSDEREQALRQEFDKALRHKDEELLSLRKSLQQAEADLRVMTESEARDRARSGGGATDSSMSLPTAAASSASPSSFLEPSARTAASARRVVADEYSPQSSNVLSPFAAHSVTDDASPSPAPPAFARQHTLEPSVASPSSSNASGFQSSIAGLRHQLVTIRHVLDGALGDGCAESSGLTAHLDTVDSALWSLASLHAATCDKLASAEADLERDAETLANLRVRARRAESRQSELERDLTQARAGISAVRSASAASDEAHRARTELVSSEAADVATRIKELRDLHASDLETLTKQHSARISRMKAKMQHLEAACAVRDEVIELQRALLGRASTMTVAEREETHTRLRERWQRLHDTDRAESTNGGGGDGEGTDEDGRLVREFEAMLFRCVQQRDSAQDDAATAARSERQAAADLSAAKADLATSKGRVEELTRALDVAHSREKALLRQLSAEH